MRIGIDLGGTKIEAVALGDDGDVRDRRRIPMPRGDYSATVRAVASVVGAVEAEVGKHGSVGVGIPGSVAAKSGLVRNANSVWLIGQPLQRDLADALRRPGKLENDANCFVLSEAVDGAGAGMDAVFGVILGTGVGGGLVVGKRLLGGRNAIAGEWGHNPMPWPTPEEWPGPACYCGKTGCIECFLSGPGLSRSFGTNADAALDAQAVAAAAAGGDADANTALALYEDRFARALSSAINLFDPDVIILGGGVSNIGRLYQNVPTKLISHVFSDQVTTPILPAMHGDASGVRGAAWLWPVAAQQGEISR